MNVINLKRNDGTFATKNEENADIFSKNFKIVLNNKKNIDKEAIEELIQQQNFWKTKNP